MAEASTALERGDGIVAEVTARRALEAGVPRLEAELLQGDLAATLERLAAAGG